MGWDPPPAGSSVAGIHCFALLRCLGAMRQAGVFGASTTRSRLLRPAGRGSGAPLAPAIIQRSKEGSAFGCRNSLYARAGVPFDRGGLPQIYFRLIENVRPHKHAHRHTLLCYTMSSGCCSVSCPRRSPSGLARWPSRSILGRRALWASYGRAARGGGATAAAEGRGQLWRG